MTLKISFHDFVIAHLCILLSSMERNGQKSAKCNSNSFTLEDQILNTQPNWTRSNSFSSCSSDSAVYCNNHHINNSNFKVDKCLAVDSHSSHLSKRNRNSSGSSISSAVSCVSDKDTEKSALVISSNSVSEDAITKFKTKGEDLASLSCTGINSSNAENQHEMILNKHMPCTTRPTPVLPFRHNLRRNIRKKTCSCDCTSTCTTIVVSRYEEVRGETVKEKTVISKTKVKTVNTCIQENAAQDVAALSRKRERKRSTEIEKLYEALQEIKWAKNFSPDNILSQINVRQAASSSVFGRSPTNKPFKRLKVRNSESFLSDIKFDKSEFSRNSSKNAIEQNTVTSSVVQEPHHVSNSDNSNFHLFENADESCSSLPVLDMEHCSASCTSLDDSITDSELESSVSLPHSDALMSNNDNFSVASDESSSSASNTTGDIEMTNILNDNFEYSATKELFPPANVPEYPVTPTFVNIAKEGLHTIDVCFREVAANVTISSSQIEQELPQLTAIKGNGESIKILTDDDPPILEPCIDITSETSTIDSDTRTEKLGRGILEKNISDTVKETEYRRDTVIRDRNVNGPSEIWDEDRINSMCSFNRMYDPLVGYTDRKSILSLAKKIVNKYNRLYLNRLKLCNLSKQMRQCEKVKKDSLCTINEDLLHHIHDSSPSITYATSPSISSSSDDPDDTEMRQAGYLNTSSDDETVYNNSDKILLSFEYDPKLGLARKIRRHFNKNGETNLIKRSDIACQNESAESESSIVDYEDLLNRPTSPGFYVRYNTFFVHRENHYIHVVFKPTRGKNIFLTFELLTELTRFVNNASKDSSVHVLVINGVGDSFCLGLDLEPLIGPQKYKATRDMAIAVKELIEALSCLEKPFVAVVNGPASGLGVTLLNHADFIIACETATFCMPYSDLGYFPEGGATLTLPQAVGSTVASDLIFRGRTLTADEACRVGLISEVSKTKLLPKELLSKVRMCVENSIVGLQAGKSLARMTLHVHLRLVLEHEVKLLPLLWLTRTCQDAMRRALKSGILA